MIVAVAVALTNATAIEFDTLLTVLLPNPIELGVIFAMFVALDILTTELVATVLTVELPNLIAVVLMLLLSPTFTAVVRFAVYDMIDPGSCNHDPFAQNVPI